jgi:hypothetical protein
VPLLPYGLKHKDKEVSKSSVCGEKILFSPGIPMLDRIHKELYVSCNQTQIIYRFNELYGQQQVVADVLM